MNRRGLLAGILSAGFAPAFVSAGILMPVRSIIRPTVAWKTLGGDITLTWSGVDLGSSSDMTAYINGHIVRVGYTNMPPDCMGRYLRQS